MLNLSACGSIFGAYRNRHGKPARPRTGDAGGVDPIRGRVPGPGSRLSAAEEAHMEGYSFSSARFREFAERAGRGNAPVNTGEERIPPRPAPPPRKGKGLSAPFQIG